MKRIGTVGAAAIVSFAALVALSPPASDGALAQPSPAGAAEGTRIVYAPQVRGAPIGRIGGSTRGPGTDLPELDVLSPEEIGLSASAQPTLHWFLGAPVSGPVEIVLDTAELTGAAPLLEQALPRGAQPGIHSVDLAARGIRLRPGVTYVFSVAVVVDPEQRSSDLVASALIRHSPPQGRNEAGGADAEAAARAFASRGYWYDAVSALSRAIEARPGQDGLRRMRAELLQQVGLEAPARHDLAAAERKGR